MIAHARRRDQPGPARTAPESRGAGARRRREADQAAPHANLGRLLLARGAVAEAVDAYREAARRNLQ